MLVSVIVIAIFVLIGKGMHVCLVVVADSRLVVHRRRLVLRLMVLRCPMLAGLTVAGAFAGPIAGAVLQGRHAVVLPGLAHAYRVVLRVRLGMAAHV